MRQQISLRQNLPIHHEKLRESDTYDNERAHTSQRMLQISIKIAQFCC